MSEWRRVPTQIESENCIIFSASGGALSPQTEPSSLQCKKKKKKVDSSSGKSIKTGNVGGIDMIIANILSLKKNEKVEGIDIIIANISLEKKFSVGKTYAPNFAN